MHNLTTYESVESGAPDGISSLFTQSPYFSLLDIPLEIMDFGYSRFFINLSHKHLNPFGGLHGGVYASAIDSAAYRANYCKLEEDAGLVSR